MKLNEAVIRLRIIPVSDQTLPVSGVSYRPTRLQISLWLVFLLFTITASLTNFLITQVGSRFDEGRYLILSRSLVYTDRYGMMNVPGEPLSERYPFAYPLLISPVVRLFPDQLDAPKVLSLVATLLNIALLFWGWPWLFRARSYWWGLAVTGLYAVSPVTVDFSRRIMTEPVFMTFSLLAILLTERFVRPNPNRWIIPGLSITLFFIVFIRTIGLVLVGCVFFYLLYRLGRAAWKEILKIGLLMILWVGLVIALTPVRISDLLPTGYLTNDKNALPIATMIYGNTPNSPAESGQGVNPSPQSPAAALPQRFSAIKNVLKTAGQHLFGGDLGKITVPFGTGVLKKVAGPGAGSPFSVLSIYGNIITALVLFGFFRLLFKERFSLFAFYGLLYLGAIFLWNWANPRLLLPIQPQIQLAFLIALEAIILWASHWINPMRSSGSLTPFALSMVTILVLTGSAINSFQVQDSRAYTGDLPTRSAWLKTHSLASDIVMSESPEVDYLYSGRKTVPYPANFSTKRELEDYLAANKVNYILIAARLGWVQGYKPVYSDQTKALLPLLEELRTENRVHLVHTSDADLVRIYQILPSKIATDESGGMIRPFR